MRCRVQLHILAPPLQHRQQAAGHRVKRIEGAPSPSRADRFYHLGRYKADVQLSLAPDERGLIALSPDQTVLAVAADGRQGGVWLVALTSLPCEW